MPADRPPKQATTTGRRCPVTSLAFPPATENAGPVRTLAPIRTPEDDPTSEPEKERADEDRDDRTRNAEHVGFPRRHQ